MNPGEFRAIEGFVVFGQVGSDAGYWVLGSDGKIHHVGGWNPETTAAFERVQESVKVLQMAAMESMKQGEGVAAPEAMQKEEMA